tara:strand:+ start:198 stop:656 length:459 start_codon:yes stop_codon:yes gene_type:complete
MIPAIIHDIELNKKDLKLMKYDLDFSEAYIDRVEELEVKCLDDEQIKTFLNDCFCDDDTVLDVWQSIQDNYFRSTSYNVWQCIDFDSQWFDARYWGGNYPKIKVYISDDIKLEVNVNIFFSVDWDANEGDYDAYFVHNYDASAIHIESITRI